jgi:hypothetical protein
LNKTYSLHLLPIKKAPKTSLTIPLPEEERLEEIKKPGEKNKAFYFL